MNTGSNLVPIVSGFYIASEDFDLNSTDFKLCNSIRHGCVSPGQHRAIRFDLFLHNIGDIC